MFDLKKFIGTIAIYNRLMQLFYDKAEAAGLEPRFDVYHVMAGDETPSKKEIEIMREIFEFNIKGTELEPFYETADVNFQKNIARKNEERRTKGPDNQHYFN